MSPYQYTQLNHATCETLFIISLVLLFSGFRKQNLSQFGRPTHVQILFPAVLIVAALLPIYLRSEIFESAIIPIAILIGWIVVVASLWRVTSKTEKVIAGILSYPGTFLVGGWPLTLVPGLLALPFGFWLPAPFMTIQLKEINNATGFKASMTLDTYSLALWISLFSGLMVYNFFNEKTNGRKQPDEATH